MTARLLVSGARVLTPGGEWPRGWIAVEGRRIAAMGQGEPPPGTGAGADLLAADGLVALPGFIDLHVHGAVGVEVMDADPDGLRGESSYFFGLTSATNQINNTGNADALPSSGNPKFTAGFKALTPH